MVKVEQIQELVNSYIENQDFGGNPKELYAPIEYILRQGGKRMRPTLCLLACDLFNGNIEDCMVPAVAAEIFHNFTLVHDDIMDQAPLRRGMETVYHKWNSDIALLSGDTMLIKAFQYVLAMKKEYSYEVFAELCKVALEVCEGQQFDLNFETQDNVNLDAYLEMIRLKTAVLLAESLEIGAIIGGAPVADADLLYNYGINLGLAFQLRDDYLDAFGDPKEFGKQIGGDIKCNKKTFLLLTALQNAQGATAENLRNWISANEVNDEQAKIKAVLDIYRETEADKRCEEAIQDFFEKSVVCAKNLQLSEDKKDILINLAYHLMGRKK